MRERGLAAVAGWGLLLAACSGAPESLTTTGAPGATTTPVSTTVTTSTTVADTTTTAQSREVVLPVYAAVDQGVMTAIEFPDENSDELVAELGFDTWETEAGVRLTLEACLHRGPGQWVFSGAAELPAGLEEARLGMWAGFLLGDMGSGQVLVATVTGSGRFAFAVDLAASRAPQGMQPGSLSWDRPQHCRLEVVAADTPALRDAGGFLEPTVSAGPLTWTAPEGTVQSLGIGADLRDSLDWRLSWAYATVMGTPLPFGTVWLPSSGGYALSGAGADEETMCREMVVESDAVQIIQFLDCTYTPDPAEGTPTDRPGWFDVSHYGWPAVAAVIDGVVVSLESPGSLVGVDGLLEIAATLLPYENLWYQPLEPPQGASADLDEAIREGLAAAGDWTERGRYEADGRLWVLATRLGEDDVPGRIYAIYQLFSLRQLSDGSWLLRDDGGGGGGSDFCLDGFATGDEAGDYLVLFVAEPDWSIQVRRDGEWASLPAVDGFFFGPGDSRDIGSPARALDASGRVVRCSTEGRFLEEGEEWSAYRPPESQRDLPVTVTPRTGLWPGETVAVKGEGFYPDTGVEVRVCLAESARWDDWMDCDEAEPAYARTGAGGRFETTVQVRAGFRTSNGRQVDCRAEECILRVDANTGVHRFGWEPLEFAP